MAHPDVQQAVALVVPGVFNALQKTGVATCAHFGMTKLTMIARFDFATQLHSHGKHAVADAEHRDALRKHGSGRAQIMCLIGARMAA